MQLKSLTDRRTHPLLTNTFSAVKPVLHIPRKIHSKAGFVALGVGRIAVDTEEVEEEEEVDEDHVEAEIQRRKMSETNRSCPFAAVEEIRIAADAVVVAADWRAADAFDAVD